MGLAAARNNKHVRLGVPVSQTQVNVQSRRRSPVAGLLDRDSHHNLTSVMSHNFSTDGAPAMLARMSIPTQVLYSTSIDASRRRRTFGSLIAPPSRLSLRRRAPIPNDPLTRSCLVLPLGGPKVFRDAPEAVRLACTGSRLNSIIERSPTRRTHDHNVDNHRTRLHKPACPQRGYKLSDSWFAHRCT